VIDLKRLREEPEYRAGIERKRVAEGLLDRVLEADDARRALKHRHHPARRLAVPTDTRFLQGGPGADRLCRHRGGRRG